MSKLTLQVTPELDAILEKLSRERGISKSQIMRRAIVLMNYLDEGASNNKDILLRDASSGEVEKLVLESQMGT